MGEIISCTVNITTTGGAGVATGSENTIPVNGFLLDVYLNYHASTPVTTDVTISDSVFGNVLVKSNNASDGWYAPRKQSCDQAATDSGQYELIPVNGALTVAVAQANALTDCLIATFRFVTP